MKAATLQTLCPLSRCCNKTVLVSFFPWWSSVLLLSTCYDFVVDLRAKINLKYFFKIDFSFSSFHFPSRIQDVSDDSTMPSATSLPAFHLPPRRFRYPASSSVSATSDSAAAGTVRAGRGETLLLFSQSHNSSQLIRDNRGGHKMLPVPINTAASVSISRTGLPE